jgi:type IV pilus assembly protein PilV
MALILYRKYNSNLRRQDGMTIIELMIAMVVLAVGIIGAMALVVRAMEGDAVSKQMSNSTALAQMVTERIMAVPANAGSVVTITDCAGTAANVNTAVGGPSLTTAGDVDYTQATVAGYYMNYKDCGTSGRQVTWDVRWNVQAITGSSFAKLLTVSAQLTSVKSNRILFAPVVTIRTVVGQGT